MTEEDYIKSEQDWYIYAYHVEGLLSDDIDYMLWLDQVEQANLEYQKEHDMNMYKE